MIDRMLFFLYISLFFFHQLSHAGIHFLTISDFHYGSHHVSIDGYDSDDQLLNLSLQKYGKLAKNVDFMITLGDFPIHSLGYDRHKIKYLQKVFHGLYVANTSKKPMFYVTGNNDSLRGNYQPFAWGDKSPISIADDWSGACLHCDGLTINKEHMLDGGYYSTYVRPGDKNIILIVLNSVQFAKTPFYIPGYPNQNKDAITQLQWFKKQLENNQSKQLLIAMHIPPGYSFVNTKLWKEPYLVKFLELLKQYHRQYGEINLLTAHTHMDDIRKIRMGNHRNIYAYATPSISRLHHNHPGMKIFELNKNMKIQNYTTYYTTQDNSWGDEQYKAISQNESVFPQCSTFNSLKNCLDSLSNESVCRNLDAGSFYGVKNPKHHSVCKFTYCVNPLA